MDDLNIVPVIVAALIPTVVGFIYYHPKVVGRSWMDSLGMSQEDLKKNFNMAKVTIIALTLSFIMAFGINALIELAHKNVSEAGELIFASHHTFAHGAMHGLFLSLFFAIPIIVTNGMYERKGWKNIMINCGYWVITLALVAGLTDAWN